ncbi:hypothetical protein RDI58_009749 [Solanum bulbocastanum]|uniref:Trichome birefringence-like C-terminal domain-containing protein n=1 Tax=Solanum bulbocastanum TaxID=147425 RepID=A0AAN8TLH5_SOLBU
MKGKRILFVGDSLGNNHWESLACLLHAALPSSKYDYQTGDTLITLKFLEYEVSLQYLRNEFLVDLSIEKDGRILKLDSFTNTSIWEGADVLIFNSYYWWTHTGTLQAGANWGEPKEVNCKGQTKTIGGSTYPGERYPGEPVIKEVLNTMKKYVQLLDITLLTQLRKDGHPSIYGTSGELDCSHWCIAGVPDTWNLLLYTTLIS